MRRQRYGGKSGPGGCSTGGCSTGGCSTGGCSTGGCSTGGCSTGRRNMSGHGTGSRVVWTNPTGAGYGNGRQSDAA